MNSSYRPPKNGLVLMETPSLKMKLITSASMARILMNAHASTGNKADSPLNLPGSACESPYLEKIASALEKNDFLFVRSMLLQMHANTNSHDACESAAAHICSLKDTDAMLLAATSLAVLSGLAGNGQILLSCIKKAQHMGAIDERSLWIELGRLTRSPEKYFADNRLCNAISKTVGMLCSHGALHTALRLPRYSSLILEATNNPQFTAQQTMLITNILLEHLKKNPTQGNSVSMQL